MEKMTEEEAEQALRASEASLAVEDRYLTTPERELIKSKLTGKITEEEFKERALQMAKENTTSSSQVNIVGDEE